MPDKERARRLRKEMSAAESIFWEKCRKHRLGFEFRRQYPIGAYVLDFFCKEAMLAVEFDGEHYDPESDQGRDEDIAMFVLRRCGSPTATSSCWMLRRL